MRPESVRIAVTVSGDETARAVEAFGLGGGATSVLVFCEDVTDGVTPVTPLLDAGVVLQARSSPQEGATGTSTVTLRPCRWSQLAEDYLANARPVPGRPGYELRIEADWAGPHRELTASMSAPWDDDRLRAVRAGALPVAELFDERQRRFLERCAGSRVTLSAVSPLAGIAATRWAARGTVAAGIHLGVRAERWQADDLDLLEVSVVSSVEGAARDQAALEQLVADRGLRPDPDGGPLRRALASLVGRASPAGPTPLVGPAPLVSSARLVSSASTTCPGA